MARNRQPKGDCTSPVHTAQNSIHDVIDVKKDGTEVTILDRAVETMALGGFIATVAARCGVSRETIYEWERIGARASADVLAGRRKGSSLTKTERECVEFVTATA